ncbi:hypothetical protein TBR22_A49310 [Luteitalea sp. TBR-22]|uniref:hypothetical protein n=1 Tax=Luteitalea sp. TBR-22 TaxID=2802971 RepID=UPI001AFB2A62|nr:hypothetical protein [Luteitalea sp. TBR-22]BCS35697.1 hypothetical protein TBR22_A49310 [Luteitalea sp. TBR-22]
MSLLAWLGHVLKASVWFAFHILVASGLFLLSANVATQPEAGAAAIFIRIFATFWLYVAAWKWLVRGVLARPEPPQDRGRKPTGAEMARSSLGCLANLVPLPFVFWVVGRLADDAWAGLTGPDPRHPARVAAGRLLVALYFLIDHAHLWVPYGVAALFALAILTIVHGKRRVERHRGATVQDANAQTLSRLRARKGGAPARGTAASSTGDPRHLRSGPPAPPARGARRLDVVLGELAWSSAESAWWAQRQDGFPVLVAGSPDGPDAAALTQAHQVVQRSFEVLLRASEAARAEAQARGVGLPRFTIAAAHVGGTDTRLHLRCDADASHDYLVRSTDGLHTFTR